MKTYALTGTDNAPYASSAEYRRFKERQAMPLTHTTVETPIGELLLIADPEGTALREIRFDATDVPADSRASHDGVLAEAARQLRGYAAGLRTTFDLPLRPALGGAFERRVWALLAEIPYGTTTTYGALATRLNAPGSARAVGAANGRNPLPIVVPCHRVIGAGGTLTGYAGGLDHKRTLLVHEGALLAV
jgi:methylated-DNA-[protein]-cysteine S-methyltransferase